MKPLDKELYADVDAGDASNFASDDILTVEAARDARLSHSHHGKAEGAHPVVQDGHHAKEAFSPPLDRGWSAWGVIIACFVYEGLQWGKIGEQHSSTSLLRTSDQSQGFPLSFGIFQNYYVSHSTFADTSHVPVIGILSTSILYLGSPIMSVVVECAPNVRVKLIWIGWALQIVALVAASFCNSVATLIITQGFMYSLGDLIVYMPMMSLINEWFDRKRGLAYGIVDASTGLTGVAFPFILEALLNRYGPKTTLRAFAIFFFIFTAPVLPLLKTRLPPQPSSRSSRDHYIILFKKPLFHIYSISNVFQGLGFFFPGLFLPTYAASLDLSRTLGALLIALVSASQFLGQLAFGFLSDGRRVHLHILMFTSSFVAGAATLTLWGLAKSLGPLIAYSMIYGFFASAFVVLYARMGSSLSEDPKAQLASYGLFSAQRGLGNILEGPLSGPLWRRGWYDSGRYGVAEYDGLIGFTGACMMVSALVVLLYHLGVVVGSKKHG